MPLHAFIALFVALFVGGVLTSYAEYKFQYNLFDKIRDIVLYLKKL
jgi:hypothetical protein